MADEILKRDPNWVPAAGGVTDNTAKEVAALRVDPITKRLKVEAQNEEVGHGSVGTGNATVATAGIAVQLSATSIPCKRVIVHAVGGHIVVGDSNVDYTAASRKGIWLAKTQRETFLVDNVNQLYIDAASDSTLVSYYYEN